MSFVVKAGKAGKKFLKEHILPPEVPFIRYTRRIERVKTSRRICAMTFDDGPMDLPAAPDRFHGRALTDVILDALAEFDAKGTFDIVGDTGDNYPDEPGKTGSPSWGGVHYDHYPDFHRDAHGGAAHTDRLIRRILDEGHQITNHSYRHILFGKKRFVYGKRVHYGMVSRVEADLRRLDTLMREQYDYEITMARPPHYVDRIRRGFTTYDVYDRLNYLYLGASFDGGGWLPVNAPEDEAMEAEVAAMTEPMRQELEKNPDFFCGQIIFQKDGYNMAKRTPVAFALPLQLDILHEYGYQVVTVEELMEESPFADVGREDPLFRKLRALAERRAVVYSDNRLRLEQVMTVGELAMLLAPRNETVERRWNRMQWSGKAESPYYGALAWCADNEILPADVLAQPGQPVTYLPENLFAPVKKYTRRAVYDAFLKGIADWWEEDGEDEEYDDEEYDEDGEEYDDEDGEEYSGEDSEEDEYGGEDEAEEDYDDEKSGTPPQNDTPGNAGK